MVGPVFLTSQSSSIRCDLGSQPKTARDLDMFISRWSVTVDGVIIDDLGLDRVAFEVTLAALHGQVVEGVRPI